MIDATLLGETAAKCMEDLDTADATDGGTILAVGIVVVVNSSDTVTSFTRTYTSEKVYYQQLGLFQAGLFCVRDGARYNPPAWEDGDDG